MVSDNSVDDVILIAEEPNTYPLIVSKHWHLDMGHIIKKSDWLHLLNGLLLFLFYFTTNGQTKDAKI